MTLDRIDRRILHLLQGDARMSIADLSERVGLSATACARRVRLLEEGGVILGYGAHIDHREVGLRMMAWVRVSLHRKTQDSLAAFEAAISQAPEVLEAHLVTGRDDYVLRVAVSDLQAYERFLSQHLTRIGGVSQIESSFLVRRVAKQAALPIPMPQEP